jgi:hypothetical protein
MARFGQSDAVAQAGAVHAAAAIHREKWRRFIFMGLVMEVSSLKELKSERAQ